MTHVIVRQGVAVASSENKSGTHQPPISSTGVAVKSAASDRRDDARFGCVYVVRPVAREVSPFCGTPIVPGSPYCAAHRSLCVVSSGSAAGRALAEALTAQVEAPEPPPELSHLLPPALPETSAEEQRPEELRSLLDHPPPAAGTELAE